MKRILLILTVLLGMVGFVCAQSPATFSNRGSDYIYQWSTEEMLGKQTPYVKLIANNVTSNTNGYQMNLALIAFKDSAKWVNAQDFLLPQNRFLRNTQISLASVQKKTYKDATLQMTFALLNRRDSAVYVYLNPQADEEFLNLLRDAVRKYESQLRLQDPVTAAAKSAAANMAETAYLTDPKKNKPDPALDQIVNDLLQQSKLLKGTTLLEAWQLNQKNYKDFAKLVQRRPLWTIYPYTSYDYVYTGFDKAGFGSTFLVSLNKNVLHQPLQLDIEGNVYKGRDTLEQKVNMDQTIASLSVGINYVLIADANGKSKFETKFAGSFQHNWEANAKQKTPNADLTLRYNLAKNFWIPVDVQYDSTRKGIFGYVSVTCNLFK